MSIATRARSSDSDVLALAATKIATPREQPGDSFVLHAPLETLARIGLLQHVAAEARGPILDRVGSVAEQYAEYAAWTDDDAAAGEFSDVEQARSTLIRSIAGSDFDGVDAAVGWLATHLDTDELVRAVVDPIIPSLAAAAHGSIFLYLLPRVAARNLPAASMLRTTAHELARRPEWQLTFMDELAPAPSMPSEVAAAELERRLARPTRVSPESSSIHPMMDAVERAGHALELTRDLAASLSVRDARQALLRTAARSMLQDDPDRAPYGWSHALTMPQATLGVAHAATHPDAAIAVAATYVLGNRSVHGSVAIDPRWEPDAVAATAGARVDLGASPAHAAAQAWHAAAEDRPAIWQQLAAHAGAHEDAHLAKYTLACIDATRGDPTHEHLYLAAAASLNSWWATKT